MKTLFKLPYALLLLLVLVLFITCSKDDNTVVQYSLSVEVNPAEGGSVSPSSGKYDDGETITLLATPSPEYIFKNWSGGASGTNNPTTTITNSDKVVIAVFEKRQYPLTIEIEGEGTVTEELLSAKSTSNFPSGSSVKLTAVPASGWVFVEWSSDQTGIDNPITVSIDKPKNIKVKFQPRQTYVPDDNFEQALIDLGYDDVLDNYVITSHIENLANIDLSNNGIVDATGIEDFVNLTGLHIYTNNLTSIDLSHNTKLFNLRIEGNKLQSLDLTNCPNLNYVFAELNEITTLDVSKNLNLVHLALGGNPLNFLDVSLNKLLVRLEVNNTLLETLDVTENIALTYLDMGNDNPSFNQNSISVINLTNNPQLIVLRTNNTSLGTLDLTSNSNLEQLEIRNTGLSTLDVSNMDVLNILYAELNRISCIKVNEIQLSNIPSEWYKDATASYSIDCSSSQTFPSEGLLVWYPFNGNANDESGNGNHGIVNGPTLTKDRNGNENSAYSFDIGGNIKLPFNDDFNTNTVSIAAWIKPNLDNFTQTLGAVVARHDGGCGQNNGADARLYVTKDNKLYGAYGNYNFTQYDITSSQGTIPNVNWSHIVFTYNGVNMKLYINGTLKNTVSSSGEITPSDCNIYTIGMAYMANGNFYKYSGVIDEVGIWDKALNESEIQYLFNN